MSLNVKKVKFSLNEFQRIRKIYEDAFPRNERMDFMLLMFLRRPKFANFLAFYDQEHFCGIAYFVVYKNTIYLQYLIIDPTVQSKGYGTKIINWLKTKYPLHNICLYIDEVNEKYTDYAIRLKRLHFYERNGFRTTDYTYIENNCRLQILFYGGELRLDRFKTAYFLYSYVTSYPKIIKNELSTEEK